MLVSIAITFASAVMGPTSTLTYAGSITAGLEFPGRLAAAPGGDLYVTEEPNGRVLQYDATGALVATFAVPEGPVGIAVNQATGRVYVSRLDGAVGVYDGSFSLLGMLDPTPFTMTGPNDLAVDSGSGEVFVVDASEDRVMVFDGSTFGLVRVWGIEGGNLGQFQTPQAIALDPVLGRVLVTDADNFRVQVFYTSGVPITKFGYRIAYVGSGELAWVARPEGIAVDSCSNIYLTDALMGTVRAFSSAGQDLNILDPPVDYGTGPGQLRIPCDILIAGTTVYVASTNNSSVEVFTLSCGQPLNDPEGPTTPGERRPGPATPPAEPRERRIQMPDNPAVIVEAMNAGSYDRELDLNRDRVVDTLDLEIAVAHFGAGTVEDFLSGKWNRGGGPRDSYPPNLQPPHMINISYTCGRCHDMDGAPGGMLTGWGQENLCLSCHSASSLAMNASIGGVDNGNSHPWGVPANGGGVPGPEAGSEMAAYLDGGNIRCGTCHNPHNQDAGSPYLRVANVDASLCKECHRAADGPTDHGTLTVNHCDDCHDVHAVGDNLNLVGGEFDTVFGHVEVSFTDDSKGVGPGAFVDPDPNIRGICEACHDYPSSDPNIIPPHTLDDTMPACTQCHMHGNGFKPGLLLPEGQFAGAAPCAICHADYHANWDQTLHKVAWNNLPPFAQTDPECLPCHTVGFGQPDGYVDQATTPELAGVQCENCHGAARDHAVDPTSVVPIIDKSAAMCGSCHQGSHHPTFEDWSSSGGHATASVNGHSSSCYVCHVPLGEQGDPPVYLNVECAACHDPHAQTGNAAAPEVGRDYQLLYPEVANPTPSNLIADTENPARFNLCGQCHHTRGARTWRTTSRSPHHSIQANVYVGEMPMPAGEEGTPLAPNTASDHAGLALQCATCHMYRAEHEDGPPEVAAITGHTWAVNHEACAGCHGSAEAAEALEDGLQAMVQARLDAIAATLGPISTWGYSSEGGPPDQSGISDTVKKVRFLYFYILNDGSLGVHNASYATAMLEAAEALLGITPPAPSFMSASICSACHTDYHANWNQTLHKVAWDNLPPFGQTNPDCLPCHTVGFGQPSGYVDQATTPQLAGVQCENCHGPASDHIMDPNNDAKQPDVDRSAAMCGSCHQGSHHPTFEEWSSSGGHATASVNGHSSSCYVCHVPLGEQGDPPVYLNVECAACHDPHAQTGNAAAPEVGRDYQLLYPEVANPTPSNLQADAMNPGRFNLCGHCHHSRGRMWTDTSRGPHHSVQANVYLGEMPVPDGVDLVPFIASDHAGLALQCNTCHMYRAEHEDGPPEVPGITGHTWAINHEACAACHGSAEAAEVLEDGLQAMVQARLDAITAALGDPSTWEYSCCGGPADQSGISTEVKKARFLKKYIEGDASLGVHNAGYVTAMLEAAEALLGITPTLTLYVKASTCGACHADQAGLHGVHGHSYKLNKVNGGPPTYPPEGIYAGAPNPPDTVTWDQVSYVIGGYHRKARFIDPSGNIYITGPGGSTPGILTQWNLEFPPNGNTPQFVAYESSLATPKPYNYSCFYCHTTGPQSNPGTFESWAEPSVMCEACHGPGANHISSPANNAMVIDSSAAACGLCHTRGSDPFVVIAKNGYIDHHEQWPELLASPHDFLTCATCHEPHTSANYGGSGAIRIACATCHPDVDLGEHAGETYVRGSYTESLTCMSCHMPHAGKSASSATAAVVGPLGRMGDIKTHVFNINTAAVDYTAMFNVAGTELLQVGGEGAVTLDFVCLRCHNGIGNAPDMTLADASTEAVDYHGDKTGHKPKLPPGVIITDEIEIRLPPPDLQWD